SVRQRYLLLMSLFLSFFNDTAPSEIYALSLHDALPILAEGTAGMLKDQGYAVFVALSGVRGLEIIRSEPQVGLVIADYAMPEMTDRKSTRLNSSHRTISYAVFCLKKKKKDTGKFHDSDS